jgi:hypothetical protein
MRREPNMRHLPSIEALTAGDDSLLLAELEICEVKEKLARVRALVDRADRLLATVLACGEPAIDADLDEHGSERKAEEDDEKLAALLLASLRRSGVM